MPSARSSSIESQGFGRHATQEGRSLGASTHDHALSVLAEGEQRDHYDAPATRAKDLSKHLVPLIRETPVCGHSYPDCAKRRDFPLGAHPSSTPIKSQVPV
jgi:hypothetical protein